MYIQNVCRVRYRSSVVVKITIFLVVDRTQSITHKVPAVGQPHLKLSKMILYKYAFLLLHLVFCTTLVS